MAGRSIRWALLSALVSLVLSPLGAAETSDYRSHPPMRPLPQPTQRPLGEGPARIVDGTRGSDDNDGSHQRPWRTIQHAVDRLTPGDTLYVRDGVYHEHVEMSRKGTADKPIVIRSYPGELAILDGGLPEFFHAPETAWEPDPEGVAGEYRSTKTYPNLHVRSEGVHVLGRFADSMVPLHGYNTYGDLQSDNVYWNLERKTGKEAYIYCGPGLFYNRETGRIHARLAPTRMNYLSDEDNYRGETDPRKLALVVAPIAHGPVLRLSDCRYVQVLDLVVRGSAAATIEVDHCSEVVLDGVTAYGGSAAIRVADTAGLQVFNTACRGIAAPWTFRGSLKYRAIEARIFSASGWTPTWPGNQSFELANCEFTDSVDGVFLGNVRSVQFHHNLVDNVSDDAMFLTAGTAFDGTTPGGNIVITQNHFSRCLTMFAFGVGHGRQKVLPQGIQTGSGVYIGRNVFDFRRPVHYYQPRAADDPQGVTSRGRLAGDHGSPAWEPIWFYQNTVIEAATPFRSLYGGGLGGHLPGGAPRRLLNNLFVHVAGEPGFVLPEVKAAKDGEPAVVPDLRADGNLHWSVASNFDPAGFRAKLAKMANTGDQRAGRSLGWSKNDVVADPRLTKAPADWREATDLRLAAESPARGAAMPIPAEWPDPLRASGDGKQNDIGALPFNIAPWNVGVRGRLSVFGNPAPTSNNLLPAQLASHADSKPVDLPAAPKKAAIVQGYPAPDVPLVEYALARGGSRVDVLEKAWLSPADYAKYDLVAVIGDLPRARIEPNQLDEQNLKAVEQFLSEGGTLLLLGRGKDIFRSSEGTHWLRNIIGLDKNGVPGDFSVRSPHAWTNHFADAKPTWLLTVKGTKELAMKASGAETLIADEQGHSLFWRKAIGRGQMVYLGWSPAASLPATRDRASSVDQEKAFEEQMQILFKIAQTPVQE